MLAVLMMLLLPLSACGGGETNLQTPMTFRSKLLNAEGCSFTADMQVNLDDCVYALSLDCHCSSDGSAEITVLAPETLEGIHASVRSRDGELEFDGAALSFALPENQELAAIGRPGVLSAAWREDYILAAGMEDGWLRVSYENDADASGLQTETWFDSSGRPVYAEITLRGRVVAELTLKDFSLDGGES